MKTLKTYYAQEIEDWLAAHPFQAVTVYQISELVGKAYIRTATMNVALKGFQFTGIMPFNKNMYSEAEFLEQHAENAVVEETNSGPTQDAQNRPTEDFATPGTSQMPKSNRPTNPKAVTAEPQTPNKPNRQTLKPISPCDINPVPVHKNLPLLMTTEKEGQQH